MKSPFHTTHSRRVQVSAQSPALSPFASPLRLPLLAPLAPLVLLVLLVLLTVGSPAAAAAADDDENRPALTIAEDASAQSQVVGIGRDVVVAGEVNADVAVLQGTVRISGTVRGDVVVLGGDARLASTARVEGEVFVLGGNVAAEPGAFIGGQSVSYPDASDAWLMLIEGPSFGLDPATPVVLAAKTALITAWLALTLLLFLAGSQGVLSTAESVRQEPIRNFFVGLTGVFALMLTALFFSAFAGALVGVPLLILVVLLLLALKLWGVVAVFYALGVTAFGWLARLRGRSRRVRPLDAACLGLAILGALKFVPLLGTWAWMIVSLIGVGATLSTKFGRREPWFELAPGSVASSIGSGTA